MIRLFLARHGRTPLNHQRRFQGQTDIPLDEVGRAQALALADVLRGRVQAVIGSDLARASESARIISKVLEIPMLEPDPDLRRTAIRNLGLMGSEKTSAALLEIYAADRDAAVRRAVIEGLFLQNNGEALVALARKESDPEVKHRIVEKLSLMQGSKPAMDYLMELLK